MLAYGLPLVPAGLAAWSMMLADRIVLAKYASLATVGFYAVANRIANLMLLAVFGFRAGWATFALELHHRDPASERLKRAHVLTDVLAGVSLLGVLIGVLSRELVVVVAGSRYLQATNSIPMLVLALVVFSTVPVTQLAMMVKHRTRDMALHSAIAAVVNIVACLLLIPRWGLTGAALANLAGFGYQSIAYYLRAQALDRVAYDLRKAGVIVGLALPYLLLGPVAVGPLWLSTLVKLVAVVTYPVALVRLGALDVSTLRAGLSAASARLRRVR
jgi:O-antigen/teichoic acid export membrane protein